MDYSLNKRKMSLGPMKGKEVYVASPVCQKQRISFDKLCARMAEDTTVGDADVAAVFYKFRTVLNQLCSQGFIVDAGPFGTFRPTFTSKVVAKEKDFKPTADFRRLKHVQYYRVTKLQKPPKPSGGGLPGSGT